MSFSLSKSLPVLLLSMLLSICLGGCWILHATPKVAFLGDSITEGWSYPAANFGKHGNTTSQMLARLPAIVAGRHFTRIVILGGTNDILQRLPIDVTIDNLESMGTEVQRSGAEPILSEIPPIFHSFDVSDKNDYSGAVHQLNMQIQVLANRRHWRLVDFYDPLLKHPGYSSDGVHMKRRGYLVMEVALLHDLRDR